VPRARAGRILVAAGTNGAGKSAIAGEIIAAHGGAYYNPDLFARKLVSLGYASEEANALAWRAGFEGLQRAISENEDFAFETTLGGHSIVRELHKAIDAGRKIIIWYVGLASPELHIARVRARVARGGHDIPSEKIYERYPRSLANLVGLIGLAAEIHVFDNSLETETGLPAAKLVFRMRGTRIVEPQDETLLSNSPEWAKPLVAAAFRAQRRGPSPSARPARKKK
jgi:predicted ABC-type ATPase